MADVKWFNPTIDVNFDFRLGYNSPYISGGANMATDDRDVGADIDALEAALGRVRNVRARDVSITGAIISYLAPDSEPCTVEYSTSTTWGTGTRQNDGGGYRVRNVSLTGLSSDTIYYYRVLCQVEQPSDVFKTR